MQQAEFWWMITQGVIIGFLLAYTASKIFKSKNRDRFPITIWGLATLMWVMGIINTSYNKYGHYLHIYNTAIVVTLKTIVFINTNVLFWVFCWGIFLISIEVQERLSQKSHWFQSKFRTVLNIVVLFLIFVSFIAAAIWEKNMTELNYSFLLIQDAFCLFSSVFYIWTLVNIHSTLEEN